MIILLLPPLIVTPCLLHCTMKKDLKSTVSKSNLNFSHLVKAERQRHSEEADDERQNCVGGYDRDDAEKKRDIIYFLSHCQ